MVWRDLRFRNGMIYLSLSMAKLAHEEVSPMLEEIRAFQGEAFISEQGAFESDLDEWDLMPDKLISKTICNDKSLQVQAGDHCRV